MFENLDLTKLIFGRLTWDAIPFHDPILIGTFIMVALGGLALVLLIDNSRDDPLKQLRFYLGAFSGFIRKTAVAVGVTHMDLQSSPSLADYQAELDRAGQPGVPVFEVDARSRRDVCLLIEAVLSVIDPVARA